jgi:hypothetical protein
MNEKKFTFVTKVVGLLKKNFIISFFLLMWQDGDYNKEVYDQLLTKQWEQQVQDPFADWKCTNCGISDQTYLEEGHAWFVCTNCNCCQLHLGVHLVAPSAPEAEQRRGSSSASATIAVATTKKDSEGQVIKGKISFGVGSRRRYKREFYYRERIAQWQCAEPPLKKKVMQKFLVFFWSGKYGSQKYISRGDVLQMCKDNKLCKYKENWKSILKYLKERDTYPEPNQSLIDTCTAAFASISRKFDRLNKKDMSRFLKGSKGKYRHHILHLNYVHRKILEAHGIYDFHREFPLLRTPAKVHALDDVMQEICSDLQIPFTRTAVILPPKCKYRFKNKQDKTFS